MKFLAVSLIFAVGVWCAHAATSKGAGTTTTTESNKKEDDHVPQKRSIFRLRDPSADTPGLHSLDIPQGLQHLNMPKPPPGLHSLDIPQGLQHLDMPRDPPGVDLPGVLQPRPATKRFIQILFPLLIDGMSSLISSAIQSSKKRAPDVDDMPAWQPLSPPLHYDSPGYGGMHMRMDDSDFVDDVEDDALKEELRVLMRDYPQYSARALRDMVRVLQPALAKIDRKLARPENLRMFISTIASAINAVFNIVSTVNS